MNRGVPFAAGVCLLAAAAAAAGCGREEAARPAVPVVKYQRVDFRAHEPSELYAGTVKGRYETALAFQVGGQIQSRLVQLGDGVKAGQTLMTMDARDIAERVRQAEAQKDAARAQLDLAEVNLARLRTLYESEAVSAAALDQYKTAYDAAAAAYQAAAAQAAQGRNALSYTGLTAGADGVIAAVYAEAGQVVSAGQPVLTLVQTDELEVEIHVPENRLSSAAAGAFARVSFWAADGVSVEGRVREIAPAADSAVRTYRVRIALPRPPEWVRLGMSASVSLRAEDSAEGAAVLPMPAICQTGDAPRVWLVSGENKVYGKTVSIEAFSGNQVRVNGLSEGDIVVTAGGYKLHEGDTVRLGAEADRP